MIAQFATDTSEMTEFNNIVCIGLMALLPFRRVVLFVALLKFLGAKTKVPTVKQWPTVGGAGQ